MLSNFRRFIRSKFGALFALLFLGVIAAAFILGDLSSGQFGSSLGGGGETVAKAGGTRLTQTQLQERVQRVFENARRANPGLQINEFLAQGAAGQIYDQLVAAMTLKEYAEDQDVHISKRLVDAQIARIPAFQDAAGAFSQENFRQLLLRERITEQALREDITREILERHMLAPLGLGVKLPDSVILPYASLLLEARQGTIAAIPATAFKDIKDPTDAQLSEYYRSNAARFTIPEQRRIRYAVIDSERFAQAAQPTDAEIAAAYNQNKASYHRGCRQGGRRSGEGWKVTRRRRAGRRSCRIDAGGSEPREPDHIFLSRSCQCRVRRPAGGNRRPGAWVARMGHPARVQYQDDTSACPLGRSGRNRSDAPHPEAEAAAQ
jgi:peptidyl-prolyl cis-trans isomerase D